MDIAVCPALGQKGNNYGDPIEISTEGNDTNGTYRHETEIQPSSNKNSSNKSKTETHPSSAEDGVNKVPAFHAAMEQETSSSSLLVSMMVICGILLGCGCWVLYAYRNPHTKSGQLLIRVSIAIGLEVRHLKFQTNNSNPFYSLSILFRRHNA